MPTVNIDRILSVSSEDPTHPAENLLKTDNKKRWKCRAGEKQATVIMQLKQEAIIDGIDIGNEHSAFIEVLVGKSSSPSSDFKVLLVASSLMTMKESKDGTNMNGVRFFKKSDLMKPTADEKWDKVKIVCTQPFNKHVQYGLSFILLHTSDGADLAESSNTALGRFALKADEEDAQPVAVGSWFAKRKDPPLAVPPGAAAAVRDASSPLGIAQGKNKKPTPKRQINTPPSNGKIKPTKVNNDTSASPKPDMSKVQKLLPKLNTSLENDEDSPVDDTDADSTYSPNKDSVSVMSDDDELPSGSDQDDSDSQQQKPKRRKKDTNPKTRRKGILNGQTPKRKNTDSGTSNVQKATKVAKETKPFRRLLEGVTIVISGYQNPLRGELRAKAVEMGAKYKPDWDNNSTHLICAFVNTPKFHQVRGQGKIVKKDWIEECHSRRKRLPWRRYALDRNDAGDSSEDEIWEEGSVPTSSSVNTTIASGVNRRRVSSGSSSDTEEEIERVRARQLENKTSPTKRMAKQKADDAKTLNQPATASTSADPYAHDTDIDSGSESHTASLPLPPLPSFFEGIAFYITGDIGVDERRDLVRYITAYKGKVEEEVDSGVEYVIARSSESAAEFVEEFGVTAVSPDWIWDCSDAGKLMPISEFIL